MKRRSFFRTLFGAIVGAALAKSLGAAELPVIESDYRSRAYTVTCTWVDFGEHHHALEYLWVEV